MSFLSIDIIPQSSNKITDWIEPEFEHFSSDIGISPSTVFSVFQDSRGFLWFGTLDGLLRFDGYEFKSFRFNPDDTTSLSNNVVISIFEDNSGMLWIGTEHGGLNKYDRGNDQFTLYTHNQEDTRSLSNNTVTSILQDKSGNLWFGTNGGGLNKLVKSEGKNSPAKFIRYFYDPDDNRSLNNNIVISIIEDKSGTLWIGTGDGLNKLVIGDGGNRRPTFIHYKHNPDEPTSLSSNFVLSIYEDKSRMLWVGTAGGGLNKFERKKGIFTHYKNNPNDPTSISSNVVSSIYEDNSGTLWVGTLGGGLNKFAEANEKFTNYKFDPNDPNSLNGNWVYSIIQDNSGLLWVGTLPGGINKFNPKKKQFKHNAHIPGNPNSLSANRVFSIYEDRSSNLWVGTYLGGLNKLVPGEKEKSNPKFIHYSHDPGDPNTLNNNSVFSIYEDKSGNLWFGTFGGGLNKLTPEEKEKTHPGFIHYDHNLNNQASVQNYAIRSILEDKNGNLWIGTDDGLNKLIPGGDEYSPAKSISFKHNPDDPSSLSNSTVSTIYEDNQGIVWIGTSGGLNKYVSAVDENSKGTFTRYTHNPKDSTSLSNNQVYLIYEDNSDNFWIGTDAGGLNKFDRENEVFIHYTEKDGLPNNTVLGILEDDEGNLWLSTRNGLSRFDPKTETFRNYFAKDGLQNNEFQTGSYFKSKNGDMYFGGVNGFISFHPDNIEYNSYIPPIVITDFRLFNKSVPVGLDESTNRSILTKSITETNEIELTYEDYIISFEFAALDFQIPEKNKYAYIMEGFDREWNYTDANRRFATYTNLDPGEYTFRVKGSNNDGIWNEQGTSLKLIIKPPWWVTWWAYTIYVLFGLVLLYSIRRYELNRTQLKNQVKLDEVKLKEREETDKMKSRFFANISHEFRTPLTLILGPAEKINKNSSGEEIEKQTNVIKRNAERLLGLINQLLDLSKLEAGKLELKASRSNIVPFIKGVTMSFESIAERKDISLSVKSFSDEIDVYFDKEKMTKIMTNLLSNAFKFTPDGGKLTVSINKGHSELVSESALNKKMLKPALPAGRQIQHDNTLEIKISDTGIGIEEEELHKLFNRFYQVDSSFNKEYEGTGIGLALTKELVELHHGTISVSSKLNKGTEFTIQLPIGRDHLKDEEIIEEVTTEEVILNPDDIGMKNLSEIESVDSSSQAPQNDSTLDEDKNIVLVVEDNADVREFIKDSLGNDFKIEEAQNGEQGVRKAEHIIPDLIISDIMMPKMDGNELTRILKNDEKTSHIPIILLTAKSEQESRLEGLETGADDYLTKPFDTKELQVRINNLISIRRKLQKRYSKTDFIPIKKADESLSSSNAKSGKLSNLDEKFMGKVIETIEKHISEEEFSIEQFANEVYMSRMQLHRKLKALTGKSTNLYVRSFRLARAKKMIEEKQGNISEIAYSVGFSSPAYFTRCFKEEFGIPPSEFSN